LTAAAYLFWSASLQRCIGFRKLGTPEILPEEYKEPASKVAMAMTRYPHLVAGKGRFDTEFMLFFQGAFLSKGGAEAVQLVSVLNRGLVLQ